MATPTKTGDPVEWIAITACKVAIHFDHASRTICVQQGGDPVGSTLSFDDATDTVLKTVEMAVACDNA
ncbi:MAG TPA: hypothetical protein VLA88_01305 [Candidatus Saccharimonadales bacterium]|nr:hypothetical protein [Candidatus Saccharimonadales bacterium]